MNILHISTYDTAGGAARATYRIHRVLQQNGNESTILVLKKTVKDLSVVSITGSKLANWLGKYLDKIDHLPIILIRRKVDTVFSFAWLTPFNFKRNKLLKNADIICLYWVGGGFLSPLAIKNIFSYNKPVVWRMSDLWPFTGGCHYPAGCNKFTEGCFDCHLLKNAFPVDFAKKLFDKKRKYWNDLKFNILCPSRWMENLVYKSKLFKNCNIVYIPTGIDIETFSPKPKNNILKHYDFPTNKKIILFGAFHAQSNNIKGLDFLQNAIHCIDNSYLKNCALVIFGENENNRISLPTIETYHTGEIKNDLILSELYSYSDIFVCPSKEENLANTALESMSCGTPCISFKIGGMIDVIDHLENGYLAKPYDVKELANGILWILDNTKSKELRKKARSKIENIFDIHKTTNLYQNWLKSLISENIKSKS
jgi:glycosyltransferase involved in cell wall biosynthesis